MTPREFFKNTFRRTHSGCIIFRNRIATRDGYPIIKRDGIAQSYTRYLWAKVNGPIPHGLVLRHTCDNPACVNLNHLIIGTHADNVADRVKRGRSAKGERNGRSKLTKESVIAIRQDTTRSKAELARRFNVDPKVIYNVKNNRTWKDIGYGQSLEVLRSAAGAVLPFV